MALNISAWAIRRPIPSLVLFAMLLPAGLWAFNNLPVANMPDTEIPVVSVSVAQSGASPGELEAQVTKRIEAAVANLAGVKRVSSSISDSSSSTTIEFALETPVDRAVSDVRNAVSGVSGDLPEAASEPVIQRIEADGDAIVTYAASAPSMSIEQLSWYIDDTLSRELLGVKGVARVSRQGGANRVVRVALDPAKLLAFNVTAAEINSQITERNLSAASGRSTLNDQELSISTVGGVAALEQLASMPLVLPGNRRVPLGELGAVVDGSDDVRASALLDGQSVVSFSVYRSKGHSDVAVVEGVRTRIAEISRTESAVKFDQIDTTIDDIQGDFKSTLTTLVEGALLAIVVVFLFLRNIRATVITSLAIPLSIIPTFFIMQLLGFSLNTFSLLAITLVTGILVDDAIVEIENIERHIRMGKTPYEASIVAADEIGLAVVATTATIVAVFVPVAFMSGIVGQFFKQFGLTVAIAVGFSLLVARLITPMFAAYFLKPIIHKEQQDGFLMRIYTQAVSWTLRWRFSTIGAGLAIFAGTIYLATLLPTGFLPAQDKGRSSLQIELPPGSTLQQTEAAVLELTGALRKSPLVAKVFANVGSKGDVRKADISIILKPRSERGITAKQFEQDIGPVIAKVPDILASFSGGDFGKDFSVELTGADGEAVALAANKLETAIRFKVPQLRNAKSIASVQRPEIQIIPDYVAAADLGVSVKQIAETIRVATLGEAGNNLAKFSEDGRLIDILVQLDPEMQADISVLENLRVRRDNGDSVPLLSVTSIRSALGPATIERMNRERQVVIDGDIAIGSTLGEALAAVQKLPEALALPEGVKLKESGNAELMGEVFTGFIIAMIAGLVLVLAVLILLFEDVLQPLTILLSLPLSAGGAFIALLLTGHAIGLSVVIGFLMLIGIVTKNAILLVDAGISEMRNGVGRTEALINAGRKRAQPIIMTTVAMAAGMLPAAMSLAEGGEVRAPMAIAVIGGLISSTFLSLVFVPTLFTIMDDANKLCRRFFDRFIASNNNRATGASLDQSFKQAR